MITAHITSEKIHSTSPEAFDLFEKSRFGEKVRDRIEYSWVEALFLNIKKKLTLNHKNKEITFDKAIQIVKKTRQKNRNKTHIIRKPKRKRLRSKNGIKIRSRL